MGFFLFRFYLRGSVIFLLIFSITWIFGYAFINRSPHTVLYGYLFALFNLLEGIYVLLFVCVQHDKVSGNVFYILTSNFVHWLD